MEKVLEAVYENHEGLPYLALQREVGMPHDTFRKYIKELRNLGILEWPSSESKKKTPVRFTSDARSKYPYIIDLPNTLLSPDEIREKQYKPHFKVIRTGRKDKQEIQSVRSSILMQYFLLRAVYGTSYRRTVLKEEEQGQAGLIRLYEDRLCSRLLSPNSKDAMAKKLKDALDPIMVEIVNIPGISVMDLVNHRDVGSGQYFWYIKATRRECKAIVKDLVSRGILVKMSNEEIGEALKNIKQREYFDPLLTEKRYKIACEALGRYVSDWDTLQYFVSKRIEGDATRKSPHRSEKERDLYEYYAGHDRWLELCNRLDDKHEHGTSMSMEVENNDKAEIVIEKNRCNS